MPSPAIDPVFAELRTIDTPTITNVVATYPKNPLCLGLYNPWTENWYTDTSIRCIYPELGPWWAMRSPASTACPIRTQRAAQLRGRDRRARRDEEAHDPGHPAEMAAGADGEGRPGGRGHDDRDVAVGCVGLLSNGPSRDVDAIRRLKFQMLLGGVTAGHGEMAVQAVNVPVSVGGMDVAPGELVHMDENGAVKFPADVAPTVLANAGPCWRTRRGSSAPSGRPRMQRRSARRLASRSGRTGSRE